MRGDEDEIEAEIEKRGVSEKQMNRRQRRVKREGGWGVEGREVGMEGEKGKNEQQKVRQ